MSRGPRAARPFGMSIRVLTADDHPLIRDGLRALINSQPDVCIVAEASEGAEAVRLWEREVPDVGLMDLRMPGLDGVAAINAIVSANAKARLVALTAHDGDVDIVRALSAGACGYLFKDCLGAVVVEAIHAAACGRRVLPAEVERRLAEFVPGTTLTPREECVLRLVAKGFTNREIARLIGRSAETPKMHLKRIMAKLGVGDRTEAVTLALQRGIIHLDE
jgi:two-component system, NarL family, response regulator